MSPLANIKKFTGKTMAYFGFGSIRRDAARHDVNEMAGWNPGVNFSGSATNLGADTILGRARDLDENNGWVNAGLDRRVEAVVGGSIRLSAQPVHQVLGRDYKWRMAWAMNVQPRFKIWSNDISRRCDARMKLSLGAITKIAYLNYARDGECFAEIRDDDRGLKNSTNVLLIERERVSTPFYMQESKYLRDGIVFDANGAATGYYVCKTHPSDNLATTEKLDWDFVPKFGPTGRPKMIHVFSPRRIEQTRGVSRLAEVMIPAKMLDKVDRSEVEAALKSAILAFFIKSPGSTDDLKAALAPGSGSGEVNPWVDQYIDFRSNNPIKIDGATIPHLLMDENVIVPPAAHPNGNYPDFAKFVLQKVAGSLGVSYPQISQDWTGINNASGRVLMNEMWRSFIEDRIFFTQSFDSPIYAAWLEMEVALGDIKVPGGISGFYKNKSAICMSEWIGPGRGTVDPNKEADANNKEIAGGRRSSIEVIRESGRDEVDIVNEELAFLKMREEMGLPPINHNLKASSNQESESDSGGGSENDRDGDGVENENQKRKPKSGGRT